VFARTSSLLSSLSLSLPAASDLDPPERGFSAIDRNYTSGNLSTVQHLLDSSHGRPGRLSQAVGQGPPSFEDEDGRTGRLGTLPGRSLLHDYYQRQAALRYDIFGADPFWENQDGLEIYSLAILLGRTAPISTNHSSIWDC